MRLVATVLVLLLGAAASATAATRAKPEPDRKEELQQLQGRIERLQRELTKSEGTRSEAADALKVTESAISEVNRTLDGLSRAQRQLDKEMAEAARQIAANREDSRRQQALLERMIRHQYRHGSTDGLRLVLEGQDLGNVERQLHYLGYVGKWRAAALERLRRNAAELAELESGQQRRKQELADNATEQKNARTALRLERQARQKLLVKVRADIAKGRKEIGRLKRDEERLTRLIEQLAKALASHREERKRDSRGETIDSAADASAAGRAFESLRGRLKLPVKGELRGRFGSPREEGGVTWKGLFIKTDGGQAVRAVADGQVVFADWVRGFGNLVVVDHGGGYMSVYGHNESLLKNIGEKVTGGENLATAGATGGAAESGVYFELRHEGKPFDPMRWVGR